MTGDVLEAQRRARRRSLLRRRDVDLSVADLQRPGDDPREIAALRHNIVQLQREAARPVEELRREYERSLSWRVTRPLRAAAAKTRGRR